MSYSDYWLDKDRLNLDEAAYLWNDKEPFSKVENAYAIGDIKKRMELAIQSRKLVSDGSDYLGKARNGNPILRFYVRKSALRDWVESEGMRKPGFLYPEGSNPLDQPKAIQERKLKSQREETLLKTIGLLAYLYVEAKKDSQDFGTPEKPNKSAVIRKAHALMSTLGVDDDGLKPSNLDAILNQAYESIGLNLKK